MNDSQSPRALWTGSHLSMFEIDGWEFARRNTLKPVVGIIALTDDRQVVLVEQYRPPVGQTVIELPAGLAGDIDGCEHESLTEAASRELLEETGFEADRWTELGSGFSSPGMTDERCVLFLADRLRRTADGGGDESESITVHLAPLDNIHDWLRQCGSHYDLKLLAALWLAAQHCGDELAA